MSNINPKTLKKARHCKVLTKNGDLIAETKIAATYLSRLKGLLGRKELKENEGLFIIPCTSIHMFFMKFSIDAVFLDTRGTVTAVYHNLKPWKLSAYHPEAYAVLEIHAGRAKKLHVQKGDQLVFE